MDFKKLGLIGLSALTLSSCCTIVNGTTQSIGIMSQPTGARVLVDNLRMGVTPLCVDMARGDNHIVRIELDGYEPYEALFQKKMSRWAFGNLVFGGIIGLAIDAISGGIYVLTPEQLNAEMCSNNILTSKKSSEAYIAIVLTPNPSWEKVGNLTKQNS